MLQKKTLKGEGQVLVWSKRRRTEEGGEARVSKSENKRGELAGDLDGRTGGGQRVSGGGVVRGAERRKQREHVSATQMKGEDEPIQINRRVRDVFVGVPPHVESKPSHALHTVRKTAPRPL